MFAVEHEDVHPDVLTLQNRWGGASCRSVHADPSRRVDEGVWISRGLHAAHEHVRRRQPGVCGAMAHSRLEERTAGGEPAARGEQLLAGLNDFAAVPLLAASSRTRLAVRNGVRAAAGRTQIALVGDRSDRYGPVHGRERASSSMRSTSCTRCRRSCTGMGFIRSSPLQPARAPRGTPLTLTENQAQEFPCRRR